MHAIANIVASNESIRSRWWCKIKRCSSSTGGCGGCLDDVGISFLIPFWTHVISAAPPFHTAPFSSCHAARPAIHACAVESEQVPAWEERNVERRLTNAGMQLLSGILNSSQNSVKHLRPAAYDSCVVADHDTSLTSQFRAAASWEKVCCKWVWLSFPRGVVQQSN